MNKFLLSLMLLVLCSISVGAQSLSVESFRPLEFDLTALQSATEKKDFNGETAALIKVVNSNTGFIFEGGLMGIVATRQEAGEIWVYVPRGIKKITIKHPTLGVLRDYFFPCAIEAARTYELKLTSGQVVTTVIQDLGGQYLTMQVTPPNSMAYIDDVMRSVDSDGTLSLFLPRGSHTYRVEAPSHINAAGIFEIGDKKEQLNIVLQSALATLTVTVDDQSAEVYVNGQKKGIGNWTGSLEAGMYAIEARRAGYRPVRQSVELVIQEQKTVSLTGITPIYGILQVSGKPINANVYIDGKLIGTSPDIFKSILVGNHELKVSKSGFKDVTKSIEIVEHKTCQEQITLEKAEENKISGEIIDGEYVDLGLSVKWASCNAGASTPEGYGEYYKWEVACKFNLPTEAQMRELDMKCKWKATTLNGVKGMKVTGPNGNSIFMPFAGIHYNVSYIYEREQCSYWSKTYTAKDETAVYTLDINNDGSKKVTGNYVTKYMLPVRAVLENSTYHEQITLEKVEETITGGYVDLGLSVKWASCNVGASTPEGYGKYYKWDEARQFNLPTEAQMEELDEKCKWKFTTLNGVKGMKITGPNGNSIFMPCAGLYYKSSYINEGEKGRWWSSTNFVNKNNNIVATTLDINKDGSKDVGGNYTDVYKLSVRPVE